MRPGPRVAAGQARVLDGLSAHIDKVLDAFYAFGVSTRWKETTDSQLEWERVALGRQYGPGGDWDQSAANYAAVSSVLFTAVAGQHLETLRTLLDSREVVFAPAPPARTILEYAGHVYWLLDSRTQSVRDRAARVVLAQIGDLTRRNVAAKAVAHPDTERFGAELRDLRRSVVPATFYPSEIGEGRRSGDITLRGGAMPGFQESLRGISDVSGVPWNTSGAYAYLSNATHPTRHVIIDSLEVTAGRITAFSLPDATLPYRITRLALMSFVRSWQISAAYHGLDQDEAGDLGEEIEHLPEP